MTRVFIQAEAAECGLASLAMVVSHHDPGASLAELRRNFPTSLKGANLRGLGATANRLGFATRALKLEIQDIGKLELPCILHWNLNHFVVLEKVSGNRLHIIDPAFGRRRFAIREASRSFTGIALEVAPTASFKPRKKAENISIGDLTGQISGGYRSFAQVLALSLALQMFVIIAPFYLQSVVDQVLTSGDGQLLPVLAFGFGFALLIQVLIGFLRSWSVLNLSSRLNVQWSRNIFAHLLRLPMDFFQKRQVGDVTSRMGSVQSIQHTLANSFIEAIIDGLMAITTLAILVFYSWKLTLISVTAVLTYLAIRLIAYSRLREAAEEQLVAGAKQQTHLLESIRGIQSLKVSGKEAIRDSTYSNLIVDTANQDIRVGRLTFAFNSINQFIIGVERIAVVWVAASLVLQSVFSVGMLIAYLAFKEQFSQRMSSLIDKAVEFRMLRLHCERLADIALTPQEPAELESDKELSSSTSIRVDNLSFRYAEGEPWIVKNCSFVISAGKVTAITGASGCGKTTLMKLLLGLIPPTEGKIHLGNDSLDMAGIRRLRSNIGTVMQDDQLFAGSISDNISFFDDPYDHTRIVEAAKLAAVHDDIVSMPMGYNSLIGDMGSALSGGQKQRVILARAIYRRPKLLFLDEATSHLDVKSEKLVNEAIRDLGITTVLIAHRPETIASADTILAMQDGSVTSCGVNL